MSIAENPSNSTSTNLRIATDNFRMHKPVDAGSLNDDEFSVFVEGIQASNIGIVTLATSLVHIIRHIPQELK
ncbi:MAG: hypothetical protein PHQ59_00365 [Candidatus Daviesbacteria bacterium]|nr:hypothetical protein [Candidatus Daviesbacteria bacterium]